MKYVPLERVFERFTEDDDLGVMTARSTYSFGLPRISWSKILEHRFAVVLGEAGSGKTREFQAQARHLNGTGRIAFFVRAEDLVTHTLTDAIDPQDADRLAAWKHGDAEAVFFVDAVDDAKIAHHATAFEKSLRSLSRALDAELSRTRVVVSCRVSDWRPEADGDTFNAFVECCYNSSVVENSSGAQASEPLIVTLAKLDARRIRAFASALDVDDIDAFITALEEQDLDMLSGRPLDVEWLVAHWQKYRAFGSLTEMLEANIDEKLRERSDLRIANDPLSPERAREGAEALAAATVLCKSLAIALPEEATQPGRTLSVVQPQRVLPSWTENGLNALLTRAVFDPATRCRVRFHHRSTQEYLAACWIDRRLKYGVPYARIRDLVIGEAYGTTSPVPSMVPVLGWLASNISELRSELGAVAPSVLLFFGDASQIPVEERAAALRHLTSELSDDRRLPWIIEDTDYKRLVDPRLSPLILELLSSQPCQNVTCRMMLRLIEAGRLRDCADAALQIALDDNRDEQVRVRAIRAAAAAGGPDSLEQLRKHCFSDAELSQSLASEFVEVLFPAAIDVAQCIVVTRKASLRSSGFSPLMQLCYEKVVVERCPLENLPELLQGLLDLAGVPPMLSAYDGDVISQRFSWVADIIVHVLRRINNELLVDNMEPIDIATAYLMLIRSENLTERTFHVERPEQHLIWPAEINQVILWHFVRADPGPYGRLVVVANQWFRFSASDVTWLLDEATSVACNKEKEIVFDIALRLWQEAGRPEHAKADIRQALNRSDPNDVLRQQIEAQLDPPPYEEPGWEKDQRLEREKRQRERAAQLAESKFELEERLEGLRSGLDHSGLVCCYNVMRESKESDNGRWGQANWQTLVPDFGESIAQAARNGFKTVWRKWRPPLPHERQDVNGIEYGVLTGLTGLRIASDDGLDFGILTSEEADVASSYALRELNGFPDWIEELVAAHPQVVHKAISAQVEAELQTEAGVSVGGNTLSALCYGPESVRQLCAPIILDQLEKGRPRSRELARKAVDALLPADRLANSRLAAMAAARVRGASPEDRDWMLTWLRVWLQTDAVAACEFLEEDCRTEVSSEGPFFLSLAASFGGDWQWRKDRRNVADWPPLLLERLMRLSLKHIVPAEDNPLRDGIYHPDSRDQAEEFRGRIATWLGESPDKEAHQALRRLAQDPDIPSSWQAHFRRQAEEHAAQATEHAPWSEAQVAEFGATHEREPGTNGALFDIVIDRLCSIKDDIERGDFSDRALFSPGLSEEVMQKWLAGRLERESRDRYSIVRENEVDLNKKPDIRVHHPRAGYVSIEIKPVDAQRYSFTELTTALTEQLLGQYMRATGSRYGVLVIGMLKCRSWRYGDEGGRKDFDTLVSDLDLQAMTLASSEPSIDSLRVIGINFATCK